MPGCTTSHTLPQSRFASKSLPNQINFCTVSAETAGPIRIEYKNSAADPAPSAHKSVRDSLSSEEEILYLESAYDKK